MLCIEDSLLKADQTGTAMVVMSNSSITSHLLKKGEELGTVHKVSVVDSPDINTSLHLQTVSYIELGYTDEDLPDSEPVEDNDGSDVVPADEKDLLDDQIYPEDKISDVVEDRQFSQEKQEWRKQQLELLYNANLNPTLSPKDKEQLLEVLVKHHSIFSEKEERLV